MVLEPNLGILLQVFLLQVSGMVGNLEYITPIWQRTDRFTRFSAATSLRCWLSRTTPCVSFILDHEDAELPALPGLAYNYRSKNLNLTTDLAV